MALNPAMKAHIRRTASAKVLARSAIIAEVQAMHIRTERDDEMDKELEMILAHIDSGNSPEGYAVMVSGKSGAGKSTIVKRALDRNPSFAKCTDEYGNDLELCIRVTTPSSCNVKSLLCQIFEATGYTVDTDQNEGKLWRKLCERLKKKQTCVILLDEFQHVLNTPSNKGYLHVSDTIKNLMQIPDWPVWLILMGVPEIELFLDRDPKRQLKRRTPPIQMKDLQDGDDPSDRELIEGIVGALAEAGQCEIAFPMDKDFVRRLMHAGLFRLGMTIQIIKYAIEQSLWDDDAIVPDTAEGGERWYLAPRHFQEAYRRISNCNVATNVFVAKEWWLIEREVMDMDGELVLIDKDPDAKPRTRRRTRR